MFKSSETVSFKKSFTSTDFSFSFPKSQRWITTNEKSVGFYEVPSSLSKRACSFGFGKRSDLIRTSCSPSPDKYCPNVCKPRGLTIWKSGIGQRLKKSKSNVPGPGSYSMVFSDKGPEFSIKKKIEMKKPEEKPSAASYNPNFSVIFKNNHCGTSFGYGKRVELARNKNFPGPGAYSLPCLFKKVILAGPSSFTKKS